MSEVGAGKVIAVLLDGSLPAHSHPRYRIFHLARVWEELGFRVRMVVGPCASEEADLYLPHVDLSRIPDWVRSYPRNGSPLINRRVVDLRRTAFSRNLLEPGDTWDGPVIVKTNANYGGLPELRVRTGRTRKLHLADRVGLALRAMARSVANRTLSRLAAAEYLEPGRYPVFPALSAVPRGVFRNRHLVAEKFLPEREGGEYFLRSYSFCGSAGFAMRTRGSTPVVKGASGHDPEFVEPHEDIVAARHELGFDYGKFDYTVHEGRAILFDVNTTPTFGPVFAGELGSRIMAPRLAAGIEQWFPPS